MRDPHCVFCKIIAGEIPCHKVYEDDSVLALLDIGPIAEGHTLVVPKSHAERLDAIAAAEGAAIGAVLPRVARAVLKATGASDFNVLQNNGESAGQAVWHVHFHVIPRHEGTARDDPETPGRGLAFGWPARDLDHERGAAVAETMRGALQDEE